MSRPTSQSGYTYGKEQGLPAAGPSMVVQGKVLAVWRVAWLSSLNMLSLLAVCCCTQALASPAPTAPACSWSSTPEFWSKMYFLQKVREGKRITPVSVSVTCRGTCAIYTNDWVRDSVSDYVHNTFGSN